jgi:hypothetical protein
VRRRRGVTAQAQAAATPTPPPADVMLYLNSERTYLSEKASAIPTPQMLVYKFGQNPDPTSDPGKFWRGLLAGKTSDGTMTLSVGVSKTATSTPSAPGPSIDFIVYKKPILLVGHHSGRRADRSLCRLCRLLYRDPRYAERGRQHQQAERHL